MKIIIKDEDGELQLTDENLDSDGFVELTVISPNGSESMTVSLNELMPALIAFDAKRSRRLSEEEYMD